MKAITLIVGCMLSVVASAETFVFTEVPARKPMVTEVTVVSRIADAESVRGTCYMRSRMEGIKIRPHPTAPACSWREADGRIIVLWANPESFNNTAGMVSGGHELFHWHEVVDHQ
jgi:hypothetical protein